MQTKLENVRGNVPLKILWKWTGVSTLLHVLLIGLLCGISYWGHQKQEAASKAKAALEDAALKKKEAEDAAKAGVTAPPATATNAPALTTTATAQLLVEAGADEPGPGMRPRTWLEYAAAGGVRPVRPGSGYSEKNVLPGKLLSRP